MKKLFVLIILFFTYPSLTDAQFIRGYGFKTGVSVTQQKHQWQNLEYLQAFKKSIPSGLIGLNLCVFLEVLDLSYLSFPIEVNYIQKGWKEGDSYYSHILNIALLAKPRISLNGFKPYLLIGPQLDIVIDRSNEFPPYSKKNFSGFILGIGNEVTVLNIKMLTELNYDFYFDALYDDFFLKVISQTFSFRIGLMF